MLLAFGGIISALSLIALFLSSALSFNTLAFLSLSSFFMGVMYIEYKSKGAFISYAVVSVLSLILPVDKTSALAFILFFGYYPILKGLIERLHNIKLEIIIKLIVFIIVSFSGVYGFFMIFSKSLSDVLPLWAVSIAGIIFFIILDYVLSLAFDYYVKKIRSKIRRG